MPGSKTRRTALGTIGLLAIAGGMIGTAAPTWADTNFTLVNDARAYDWAQQSCWSTIQSSGCSWNAITWSTKVETYYSAGEETAESVLPAFSARVMTPGAGAAQYFAFSVQQNIYTGILTMKCELNPGTGPLTTEPDYGTNTCTVAPATTTKAATTQAQSRGDIRAAHVRMTSNRAVVKQGKAKVRVTSYALKKFKVNEKLVLRDVKGKVIGSTTTRVVTGKHTYLKVPLPPKVRKQVRANKVVVVTANLKHADNTNGSGHRTTRLVLTK